MSRAHPASLFRQTLLALWLAFSLAHPLLSAPVAGWRGGGTSASGTLKTDRADPPRLLASEWSGAMHQLAPVRKHHPMPAGPAGEVPVGARSAWHDRITVTAVRPGRLPGAPGQSWRFVQGSELRPRAPSAA